ncbi:MAG: hypothetical protein WC004_03890 [Candidatus Absconditabacterales bacterium]
MSLLESFGSTLQNVGGRIDDLTRRALQEAGFKQQLQGVFDAAKNTESVVTAEKLQLPEFYQKAVNVLLENEKKLANVNNLAEFMQALVDTKAYSVLNAIDSAAPVALTGSRQDDFVMVLAAVRIVAGIVKDYTPQDVNFDKAYKFGLAGNALTVMVRQADGNYLPLVQNTQTVPDNTSFRNIVPAIRAHMSGLPGGYEVIHNNVPVVAAAPIDPAKVAQELVNNPAGTPVAVPNQINPNQSTLTA